MSYLKIIILFAFSAATEILGCYLFWLILKEGKSNLLFIPAVLSLVIFAWLLTFHPSAAGRTYAAYGGMYIVVALIWLRFIDGIELTRWDLLGGLIALIGMSIIAFQPISKA